MLHGRIGVGRETSGFLQKENPLRTVPDTPKTPGMNAERKAYKVFKP
jgi:hypothetical protein